MMSSLAFHFRRINSTYTGFLSGVLVSASLEVYIGMLLSNGPLYPFGLLGSCSFFISAFFLMVLTNNLEGLHENTIDEAPDSFSPKETEALHLTFIQQSLRKLSILLVSTLLSSFFGVLFIAISFNF